MSLSDLFVFSVYPNHCLQKDEIYSWRLSPLYQSFGLYQYHMMAWNGITNVAKKRHDTNIIIDSLSLSEYMTSMVGFPIMGLRFVVLYFYFCYKIIRRG